MTADRLTDRLRLAKAEMVSEEEADIVRGLRWGKELQHAAFMASFAEHRAQLLDVLRAGYRGKEPFDPDEAWRLLEIVADWLGLPMSAADEKPSHRHKQAGKIAKACREAQILLNEAIGQQPNGFIPATGAALIEARLRQPRFLSELLGYEGPKPADIYQEIVAVILRLGALENASREVANQKPKRGAPVTDVFLRGAISILADVYRTVTGRPRAAGVAMDESGARYIPSGSFPDLVRGFLIATGRGHLSPDGIHQVLKRTPAARAL